MKHNMGTFDRLFRILIVAPALLIVSLTVFGVGSVLGIAALVVAGIMLATSAVGFCPAYTPFGISTRRSASTAGRTRVVTQH